MIRRAMTRRRKRKETKEKVCELIQGGSKCSPFDISITMLQDTTGRYVLTINNVLYDIDSRDLGDVLYTIGMYLDARCI